MSAWTLQERVSREVYYCVSYLITELAKDEKYMEELLPVMIQDDWENAARAEGWEKRKEDFYHAESGGVSTDSDWRELCESHDIEPHQNEAYEHWIVSGWLADKLEARGEMILKDFLGLTIWGRAATGQAICLDSVIQEICKGI